MADAWGWDPSRAGGAHPARALWCQEAVARCRWPARSGTPAPGGAAAARKTRKTGRTRRRLRRCGTWPKTSPQPVGAGRHRPPMLTRAASAPAALERWGLRIRDRNWTGSCPPARRCAPGNVTALRAPARLRRRARRHRSRPRLERAPALAASPGYRQNGTTPPCRDWAPHCARAWAAPK